jgi:hypothetical protein
MPASYAIASELSYLVLQKRRREGELAPCLLDSLNRRLYGLPSQVVGREAFSANRRAIPDSWQGELPYVPSWAVYPRKG